MAGIITNSKHYEDIADAIRAKNGSTQEYYPEEMAEAIMALNTEKEWIKFGTFETYSSSGLIYDLPESWNELYLISYSGNSYDESSATATYFAHVPQILVKELGNNWREFAINSGYFVFDIDNNANKMKIVNGNAHTDVYFR